MVVSTRRPRGRRARARCRARHDAGADRGCAALAGTERRAVSRESRRPAGRRRLRRRPRQGRRRAGPRRAAARLGARRARRGADRARARRAGAVRDPAQLGRRPGCSWCSARWPTTRSASRPSRSWSSGLLFVFTIATYVEGSSLHPERGGASTFARYAFDELWSFIAGWAILLDYLIVMAIGAVAISDYLAVFWTGLDDGHRWRSSSPALAIAVRRGRRTCAASPPTGSRMVLRLSLVGIVLLGVVAVVGLAQNWDPASITDSIDLGSEPQWDELLFATVVAGVALIGVEAASGLAGEVRVGRRGLRRVVVRDRVAGAAAVRGRLGRRADGAAGGRRRDAARRPATPRRRSLGMVTQFHPDWLQDTHAATPSARSAAALLLVAMNSQMLGTGAAVLLARHQPPDPERRRPAPRAPRHALHRDHERGRDRLPAGAPARPRASSPASSRSARWSRSRSRTCR